MTAYPINATSFGANVVSHTNKSQDAKFVGPINDVTSRLVASDRLKNVRVTDSARARLFGWLYSYEEKYPQTGIEVS